jgi:hypothetical protein
VSVFKISLRDFYGIDEKKKTARDLTQAVFALD